MLKLRGLRRPGLFALSVLFAAATVLYSAIWIYAMGLQRSLQLGIEYRVLSGEGAIEVSKVLTESAAEEAGLRKGDWILALDGRSLETQQPIYDLVSQGEPGGRLEMLVRRPEQAELIRLQARLRLADVPEAGRGALEKAAGQLLRWYPLLFILVGLPVLFLRLEDVRAWLMALLFAGFVAAAPILHQSWAIASFLRGFTIFCKILFHGLWPALFYSFFAVFPSHSPLDRKFPWLKHSILAVALLVAGPLAAACLVAGDAAPAEAVSLFLGSNLTSTVTAVYFFGVFGLGLTSLIWNSVRPIDSETEKKSRVLLWGTAVGIFPCLVLSLAAFYLGVSLYELPFPVWAPCILALFLIPLSFAYAVVKHRVLAVPLLLRRSARYLLVQRGFTLLLNLVSLVLVLLFAVWVSRFWSLNTETVLAGGIALGAVFGVVVHWAALQVQRKVTEKIDRAFFRSSYDARQILDDLAERTRTAASRKELASLLEIHLREALHPRSLAVYLCGSEKWLESHSPGLPVSLERVSSRLPELAPLRKSFRPLDVPLWKSDEEVAFPTFRPLRPECLVPIPSREGGLIGLIVLGPRLSEEPYSREDKRLLSSVSSQAGIALDNILLAEQMAERLEEERRAAQEMVIARQVQKKLFPQQLLPLRTLEYSAECVQTRAVGGRFLRLSGTGRGSHRTGAGRYFGERDFSRPADGKSAGKPSQSLRPGTNRPGRPLEKRQSASL